MPGTDYDGPMITPDLPQMIAMSIEMPMVANLSGEITADSTGVPVGAPRFAGRVYDAYLSVEASGKDDSNDLSLAADVKINGTTCLTTQPTIAHVSGESSQQKTTRITGDTGITQAAVSSSNSYNPGDNISVDWDLTRTASPTTEMANASLVIMLKPD